MRKRLSAASGETLRQALISGLFWFSWAFGSYETVYLQKTGFTASLSGAMNALNSCVTILAVAFWGAVSDRLGSLKRVLVALIGATALLYALVPLIPRAFPGAAGGGFLPFFLILPAIYFFRGATTSMSENFTVRSAAQSRLNYGIIRSAGSLVYTVGCLASSALLPLVGVENTFVLSGLLAVPVILLIRTARDPGAGALRPRGKLRLSRLFRNRAYALFLLFVFFYQAAHVCQMNFVPYLMAEIGIPSGRYGLIIAYRALLEVPMLLLMARLRRHIPLRLMLILAPVLMTAECVAVAAFVRSLWSFLAVTTCYGLGNGVYIGAALNYVYELAPDDLKASSHAFFTSVTSTAGILGNLAGGVLFETLGYRLFYLALCGIYGAGTVLFYAFPPRRRAKAR